MTRQWDALILGAGPAGLKAATVLADSGIEVVLVDEQAFPGGQIYRHITAPHAKDHFFDQTEYAAGLSLAQAFENSAATYLPETTVWFIDQGRVLASQKGQTLDLQAKNIILAVGAMERPVPFPGWTLPGVMQAGAGDILMKTAGLAPKGPIVLAGSGPLLYLVASHLLHKGANLTALLDQTPLSNACKAAPFLPCGLLDWPLLVKGLTLMKEVLSSKIPVYRDVAKLAAQGSTCVETVSFVAKGQQHTLPAATLLYHGGVIPRTHIANALDLPLVWDKRQQCWNVACDIYGATSREGVYVAGDCARVRGAQAALLSGELAALHVARRQGALGQEEFMQQSSTPLRALKRLQRSKAFLDAWFSPRADLYDIADDVILCRCEHITAGEVRAAVADGITDINEIKLRTRTGMGNCQGRTCGPALAALAAQAAQKSIPDLGCLHIRPPLRPVSLNALWQILHLK